MNLNYTAVRRHLCQYHFEVKHFTDSDKLRLSQNIQICPLLQTIMNFREV